MPEIIDPPALQQQLPEPVSFQLQAATDTALTTLCITLGLLVPGEGGILPAPGVLYSHIGDGYLEDGTKLAGRYAFVSVQRAVFGEERTVSLLVDITPHQYSGPALRAMLGGSNFDPDAVVPQAVTMRQARLALLAAGKLSMVTAAINALPEPLKSGAQITWEYSTQVQRRNGLVPQMAAAIGMSDAEVDALFVAAAKL